MAAVDVPTRAAPQRRRRRADETESLSQQLMEARRRGELPQALLERYEAARSAFAEISGLVPSGEPAPDDVQRLRILDTVILELVAVEREMFVLCGTDAPESVHHAYNEFLERLNRPVREPREAAVTPEPTGILDLLRAGRPVSLRLDVDALTPSGLVAMGQLLNFERGVRVERLDGGAA